MRALASRVAEKEIISANRAGVRIAALLLAAYILAFAQRQLPAAMSEAMLSRFGLSDAGFALLLGACFALPYATLAIIAGALADRVNRLRLAGTGLAIASLATIGSTLAVDSTDLITLRLFIGVGQSALVPAAYSILGDIVAPGRAGGVAAGFATGPFIGMGLAFVASGQLAGGPDGAVAFFLMGVGGLVATVPLLMMKEPARAAARPTKGDGSAPSASWRMVACVDLALGFAAMGCHALAGWGALWLCRVHNYSHSSAILAFGLIIALAGVAGSIMAGSLRSSVLPYRLVRRLGLMAGHAMAAAALCYALFSAPAGWVLVLLAVAVTFAAAATIAGPVALQEMTLPARRGRQHGIAIAVVNLVGSAGGPLIVGLVSGAAGEPDAIGLALKIAVPAMFAGSALFATGALLLRNRRGSAGNAGAAILDRKTA